ncbi:hypothetical protein HQ560_09425, partial [bacterium]|nr:hypothetical protein [bacterium]
MRAATLIQRSLGFYWRTHAGVLLGAAVASAVLVGALVVGDSVRFSLQRMAIARLGNVSMAVAPSGRLFREKLGDKIAISLVSRSAPVLHLRGTVVRGDGSVRANRAEVLGVDSRFWGLGAGRDLTGGLPEDAVLLNERLAAHLGVGRGDEIVVRVEKPSALSRDAPLVSAEDASLGMRVTVAGIVGEGELGTYSLRANPVPPFNVFAPLRQLQKAIGQEGKANTILVGETEKGLEAGNAGLRDHWRFEDAGLELSELKGQGRVELRTKRVFLDPVVAAAAREAFPEGRGVLTYLVNEIRHGARATPYSMVTALGPGQPLPEDMKDDEIVISQWLATDLAVGKGAEVTLKYYVVGPSRKLEERTSVFRVRAI